MVKYRCGICNREFSTAGGLIQHANAKHNGRTSLSRRSYTRPQRQEQRPEHVPTRPEHDENLWNRSIVVPRPQSPITLPTSPTLENPLIEDDPFVEDDTPVEDDNVIEDVMPEDINESEPEPRYNLRSQTRYMETEENIEENTEESEEELAELQLPGNEETDIDLEDLQGASLDDALETIAGKNKPENIAGWLNDAYRDFMKLIIDGNISNKIGDKIIKLFNKYSKLEKSPLPKSTKSGKDYLNQINSPSLDFKEKVVATHSEVDFKLYYRPVFRAIQALVQRPEVADNFVHKGSVKKDDISETRKFGEPYEDDWWLETEKTLPPLNHLLSVILYSDATTFDGLGKTSGHPVFLTFGNLPNWLRNTPEAKVLLGFLPKVQDSGIKTNESFRRFQREVYQKCFDIMLRPLLEKPDALHFGIKGRVMIFAA